jgi:hypothetical protein
VTNKNKKNISKKDIITKLILIIIIILLLIHNCCLLNTLNNGKKTPTGNVDIFEISCDRDSCEENSKGNDLNSANLIVSDNDITWKSTNKLRIFTNPVYNMNQKVAPEDSNVYQFVIKNNTKYNVRYNINFIENNPYNINMKYKLKKGDKYIINDYVDYNELKQTNITLNKNNSDTYYLEWKWVSSNNDTDKANIENAYNLNIEIEAENVYE